MKKFKNSKRFYKNKFFEHDKCYLIFIFFNVNLLILDLLKRTIEDCLGLKILKIENNFNITSICLELSLKNYAENKEDLNYFFLNEDFKFYLASVFYKNNHMEPVFFENEFLQDFENFEELMYFNYINILNNLIENKKIIFFFYNVLVLNKTILNYNAYNTSSRF